MDILALWALLLTGMFGIFSCILLMVLLRVTNRLADVNKQLLIFLAGKEPKPEALRALITSDKPPQGKLRGVGGEKKKEDEGGNTNYTIKAGVH